MRRVVGVAATARMDGDALKGVQLAFLGTDQTPVLATTAMAEIEGKKMSPALKAAASKELQTDHDTRGEEK